MYQVISVSIADCQKYTSHLIFSPCNVSLCKGLGKIQEMAASFNSNFQWLFYPMSIVIARL